MDDELREPLSLEAAAGVLKVGLPTLRHLIDQGLLAVRQVGPDERIAYADLLAYMRESQRAASDEGEPPAPDLTGSVV